jgi:Carboxypeptidase regulatory-like domain
MKQTYLRVIACTLSVVLLYPAFAVSQTNTGSLSGTVIEFLGAVIPKAKVWATRKSDPGAKFETTTDQSGKFSFTNLPPDVYQLTVSKDSGVTAERTVKVSSGRMAQLEIQFGTGCDNVPKGSASDDDKAEVFRSMLTQLTAPESGWLNREQREGGVVLSTKNIKPEWLQGVEGLSIELLTPAEVQRRADRQGDFLFLSVPELKVRSQCIAVTLSNSWAIGKNSKSLYMSGTGFIYEFRKESGKWVGRYVTGWVI